MCFGGNNLIFLFDAFLKANKTFREQAPRFSRMDVYKLQFSSDVFKVLLVEVENDQK